MPRFRQTGEILQLMSKKEAIRNIGIIAHIDHGKTTTTDSLLAGAGLLSPKVAGEALVLDYLDEEQKRGMTIKTANISLLHEIENRPYIINLIDTPGHVDFTGKVTRALRAIDGAIVVIDAVEEVMAQTETVTRQALDERVRPVLYINKIDRLVKELRLNPEEIQKKLVKIINDFNNFIEIYGAEQFKKTWKADFSGGSVAFGSSLHKWGFTAEIAQKKGVKFSDIIDAYQTGRWQELQETLPLHDALLSMAVRHFPNPVEAQQYRVPQIWKGAMDSEIGKAMLNCDDDGPTTLCITMVQMDPHAGLIAAGRLFSGSIRQGDQVYLVGVKKDYRIQQVSIYMGSFREIVDRVVAGNIAAVLGLDLARTGETLVDFRYRDLMVPFERIRYLSEPVVTIALEPKRFKDMPRLVDAMQRLVLEDPNLVATINKETGEYLLSGIGELHLEIAAKFLRDYSGGLEITASRPIVVHRECVSEAGAPVMAKSLNRHNKFWVQVEPLTDMLLRIIEKGEISEGMEQKRIAAILQKEAGWSAEEVGNVWAIEEHRNLMVNATKDVPYLQEVRDMIISGFKWACQTGPLCEEPMRGVKVRLVDAQLHEEPVHRDLAQVMPSVRKAIFGSFLKAKPVLLEPVYNVEVSVPTQWVGEISNLLNRKRGKVTLSEQRGLITMITGYIPVAETFGLAADMRSATAGHAFWQSSFDHWEKMPESIALSIIREMRERKGLPPEIPAADRFIDKD